MFLSKFDQFQKKVSCDVRRIGGSGYIHGCIVDLDFYNHLYINPLDGTIAPYHATSIVHKFVYSNVPSLLKYQCPNLYENFEKLLARHDELNALTVYKRNTPILKQRTYVVSTEMYKISRIVKGLQYTTRHNIVRLWNDTFVEEASEENGRLIVSGIIDPISIPHAIEAQKDIKAINPKHKRKRKQNLSSVEITKKKFH